MEEGNIPEREFVTREKERQFKAMSSLIALASSQFGIIVERVHVGRDIGQCQLIAKLNIYKINLERERERERERGNLHIWFRSDKVDR